MERHLDITLTWDQHANAIKVSIDELDSGLHFETYKHQDGRGKLESSRILSEINSWIDMMYDELYYFDDVKNRFNELLRNGELTQYTIMHSVDELESHLMEISRFVETYIILHHTLESAIDAAIFGVLDDYF